MKQNFDEVIDRTITKERRWSKGYILENWPVDNIEKVIDSTIADLDFATPQDIRIAIENRAKKLTYSYTYVRDEVLNAILYWYDKSHNIRIEKQWIKLVHGTVNALHQIVQAFTNKNDCVLIQTPIYEPFGRSIYNNNRKIIENKLIVEDDTYKIDFSLFENQIKDNNIKLFLWCNPHNPGGVVWQKQDINKMIEILNKYNVLIVSDEVHSDLILQNNKFTSILESNVKDDYFITCVSPNKTFNLGGLKGSYLIIKNTEIKKVIDKIYLANSLTSPNVFYQEALLRAYISDNVYTWLQELKRYIKSNFDYVKSTLSILPGIKIMNLQASYLVWIYFDTIMYSFEKIHKNMLKHNLIVNWHSDFYGADEGWFRLNIGSPLKIVKKLIKRICQVFK